MKVTDIKDPSFLKDMNIKQLNTLSDDIREFLITSISKTGGHLSSNLGVVELTVALHKVFDSPNDKFLFDVGHQCYTHKILTGRANQFDSLRQFNGLSGYQKRNESIYDCFEAGHSSTSISTAVGMAVARDLNNEDYHVLPIIGDGSLTGGLAFEAINHLGDIDSKVIVILNDNEMSISQNIGGVSNFLKNMRISMPYNKAKQNYKDMMKKTKVGNFVYTQSSKAKKMIKDRVISNLFTDFGLDYLGPIDGHDYQDLLRALEKAKKNPNSIIVHVLTKKGKGYKHAENDSNGKWHGVGEFDLESGETIDSLNNNEISWSQAVADIVLDNMDYNEDIVCITPAMIGGSKLQKIFDKYPDRSYDVGIAEQHATTFASGLALMNKHPYLTIYSSFTQRSYDQFNHDLARMSLPVVVGVDRAGLVGEDGETHHGVFDISLFRSLPNFIVSAPGTLSETNQLIKLGFSLKQPFVFRYPRGKTINIINDEVIELGKFKTIYPPTNKVLITYGEHSYKFKDLINKDKCGLIHALFIKPLDYDLLDHLASSNIEIIIYEPDIKAGGFASSILEYFNSKKYNTNNITILSIDDQYVLAGNVGLLLESMDLDYEKVVNTYCET